MPIWLCQSRLKIPRSGFHSNKHTLQLLTYLLGRYGLAKAIFPSTEGARMQDFALISNVFPRLYYRPSRTSDTC